MLIKSDMPIIARDIENTTAEFIIEARGVAKAYTLYPNATAQAADLLGLNRLFKWRKTEFPEHLALHGIDLALARGERVGIIGRNGSGKTTLLKLISGMIAPSAGTIQVNGRVQALMQVGVGFHPDYSGLENIRASLLYTGLAPSELKAAEADIIEFCELGEFLAQPLKTYSLGMQARLQFACATAIKPEILIVDEILGAGDAYFSVKSNLRMQRLTKSGCTLLLVSHSMAQVLQFCERAIWIDGGKVRMAGTAKAVVKQYEEFMYDETRGLRPQIAADSVPPPKATVAIVPVAEPPSAVVVKLPVAAENTGQTAPALLPTKPVPTQALQTQVAPAQVVPAPTVERLSAKPMPATPPSKPEPPAWTDFTRPIPEWQGQELATLMSFNGASEGSAEDVQAGGSRWVNDARLRIVSARVLSADGQPNIRFEVGDALAIEINFEARDSGTYPVWWVALVYGDDGRPLVRHVSDRMDYTLGVGDCRSARIVYPAVKLGKGDFHVSVAIYRKWDPDNRAAANWYELLNRSIEFRVEDERGFDPSLFHHPARWAFRGK